MKKCRPERGREAGESPQDGGFHVQPDPRLKDVQSSSNLSDVGECLSAKMWIRQLPKAKGKCKTVLEICLGTFQFLQSLNDKDIVQLLPIGGDVKCALCSAHTQRCGMVEDCRPVLLRK